MDERFDLITDRPRRIHLIDEESDVGSAVEHLLKFDLLGFDTETYHKFDRHIPAFDPTNGARMRLAQFATPEGDAFVFDLYRVSKKFLYHMFPNPYLCVIQNAKFDLKFLMFELGIYNFGPIFDTLIAEQVLSKGRVTGKDAIRVSLDQIAYRRIGAELPKDEQASSWYMNELSDRQIKYAGRDAQILLSIFQKQRDELLAQSQVRVAELEFGVIPAYSWMENNGIRMNGDKWLEVCDKTAEEITDVKDELWSLLGRQGTLFAGAPTINLDSKQQVQAAFEDYGITLPIHPETGQPTLSNKLLENLNNYRAVELYIEYVKKAKLLSSYGPKWLNFINPYDDRIHYQLKQIGAETGRSACKDPNLMQIPKENFYRNCFEAQPGWVFVDLDYSQCELRILAELCRDPNLLKAFDSNQDLHRFTAHLLFQIALAQVSDYQRGVSKNMNFLMVYGGGASKLATQANIAIEIAESTMALYLNEVYPGMRDWLEKQARMVLNNGLRAYTMTGRIRQYMVDLSDKKEKSRVQRNAKNLPIQGTNADITKLALAQTYKALVKGHYINDIKLILPIHDEILSEAKPAYAETAQYIIHREMMSAEAQFLKRVPCKVDGSITRVWCKDPSAEQLKEGEDIVKYG
jgi:DNA polymerase-1